MRQRLAAHAVGDAALDVLRETCAEPPYVIVFGDFGRLDEIAYRAGVLDLDRRRLPTPIDRHIRVLNVLDRDARFEKFLFRCWVGNREALVRGFRLRDAALLSAPR